MATSTDNFNPKLKIAYRILVQVAIRMLEEQKKAKGGK